MAFYLILIVEFHLAQFFIALSECILRHLSEDSLTRILDTLMECTEFFLRYLYVFSLWLACFLLVVENPHAHLGCDL